MAYYLGVDIGTTYTAAAVWRDGRVEIASLGNRAPVIPSVVFLRDDGRLLIGEPAARRGAAEPQRVAREFKRRIGDPTPIIIGGTPYSADALIGKVLAWVVEKVTESEGGPPDSITVSHPANWGAFKKDLLRQAIRRADLDEFRMVTEPEAAAIHYASQERIEPGAVIAVYDLGGGTFDVALLRKRVGGWDILGEPEGIERLGGVDFDEAVFQHVMAAAGGGFGLEDLDPDDGATIAAVARLRQECIEAKEALSSDSDVTVPVLLPTLQTEVRLTRAEFEQMIRPTLSDSIAAINRALRSAKVEASSVTAVLLVGGSSRIPLVAELVSSELGRPVAVDAHPKYGIALGAAILAADHASAGTAVTTEVRVVPELLAPAAATAASAAAASTDTNGGGAPAPGAAAAALAAGAVGGAVAAAAAGPHGGAPTAPAPAPAPVPPPAPPVPARPTPAAPAPPPSPSPAGGPPAAPPAPPAAPGGAPAAPAGPPSVDPAPGATRSGGFAAQPPAGTPSGGYAAEPDAGVSRTQPWPGSTPAAAPSPATGQLRVPAPPSGGGQPPASGGSGPGSGSGGGAGFPAVGRAGGGGRNFRPVLLGTAAVVALIAAVAFVLTLGGDDDPTDTAGTNTTVATGDETTAPPVTDDPGTTATTAAPSDGPFVEIDGIEIQDGRYLVSFTVTGFTPGSDPGSYHTHFFLNDVEADNAGSNGTPPGDWDLTYESGSYLTKYGPGDLTSRDATQMCSLVAGSAHEIAFPGAETGTCIPLPLDE